MSYQHIQQLKELRAKAHAQAVGYLKAGLTSGNQESYGKAMDEVESLGRQIQSAEGRATSFAPGVSAEKRDKEVRYAFAFDKYLRQDFNALDTEERKLLNEKRDQTAGTQTISQTTGSAGGFLVPAGFAYEIEVATKWYAQLMDTCRLLKTDSGSVLPFPTNNDTGNVGALLAEGAGAGQQDLAFGSVSFQSYKFTSKVIKVSAELLQDSAFNLYDFIAKAFGNRLGRVYESYFTTGSGVAQPTGILTAIAASGAVPVSANGSNANDGLSGSTGANSIGSQDLVNLEHSVDPSYRRGAKYMFSDKTLGTLKGLLDKYGRPLWTPSVAAGEPDKINGYAYVINQSIPNIAPSAVTVAFGDWSKFIIRKVNNPSVIRLNELYAVNNQVGFLAFERVDSNLIDAGTHPLNVLQQHS
jgi:HK97 family phage major capsid protein